MSNLYHPYKKGSSLLSAKSAQNSKTKKTDGGGGGSGPSSDYNLVAPIRQTASIFKQPVTLYKEHKSKVKPELKHVSREKPLQLFWTRRLSSLNTENVTEGDFNKRRINLPPSIKSTGPGITDHMLLASISTHLHISKDPASGQTTSPAVIEKPRGLHKPRPASHVQSLREG